MTDSSAASKRAAASTRGLLREPLLWFAALGGLIFLLNLWQDGEPEKQIVVTAALQQRLSDQWQGQMGRAPSAKELNGLVEQWIKEEIYAREAAAMGLDQNDTIIRRRLVQKLTFLTEDIATAAEPDQATLQAYFETHQERYRDPARFDFEHRYFSSDRREDAAADAKAALASIQQASGDRAVVDSTGDAFMLQLQFANRSERQIGDLFGREFARKLAELARGTWHGPVPSAYGEHLVRITAITPSAIVPLASARSRVLADYAQSRREAANEAFYEGLRGAYQIEFESAAQPAGR